jgi:alkylglycerol monooxygenase
MINVELVFYIVLYDNYRLFELPWNSPWTWILTMLGVDLGYYWIHRFGHG